MERDVRSGDMCLSLKCAVSANMRACIIGVYAKRESLEEGGMKERVSMRQACCSRSEYLKETEGRKRRTNSD